MLKSLKKKVLAVLALTLFTLVLAIKPSPVSVAAGDGIWSIMNSGTTNVLRSIWGTSSSNVFAVGYGGTIIRYNGTNWVLMNSGTENNLSSVWGNSVSSMFAVGDKGTILRYDGNVWNPVTSGTEEFLSSIGGNSSGDVFIVGNNGIILHYNSAGWRRMTSPTANPLHNVWVSSNGDVFAVGNSGTILHYNGSSWSAMNSNTQNHLVGVWGSSSKDVFAVGYGGIILHYDGAVWNQTIANITGQLYGVWGSSANDVFAVGDSGVILHYDGKSWNKMNSVTQELLGDAWGSSASDVFAVGFKGTILHCGGAAASLTQSISQPASTPKEVVITGKWNGSEMSVPVEIRKGDRIVGDMSISRYNMWARITAPPGKIIVELNKVPSAHMDYIAEASGTLYFTFVHLYGIGSPEYRVAYIISQSSDKAIVPQPTIAQPPQQSAPGPGPAPPSSTVDSPTWGWIIVGFIVMGIFFAFAAARNKTRRHYQEDYDERPASGGDVYVHQKRRCTRCHGTGKVERPMMGINRGGIGMPQRPMMRCPDCDGTGWVWD